VLREKQRQWACISESWAKKPSKSQEASMKTYKSKEDVYVDHPIALKFELEKRVHFDQYEQLLKALPVDCRAKVERLKASVEGLRGSYPHSVGFVVEIPVLGDTGDEMSQEYVLLTHETGWEYFIPSHLMAGAAGAATGTAGGYLAREAGKRLLEKAGEKALEKAGEKVLERPLQRLFAFMQQKWMELINGGVRIKHVEIRTLEKGVMRIRLSDLVPDSIECLLVHFESIKHIRECDDECFFKKLYEAEEATE
jgi:hypothetical protein